MVLLPVAEDELKLNFEVLGGAIAQLLSGPDKLTSADTEVDQRGVDDLMLNPGILDP